MHDIKCPTIPVECKNFSEDISSPEFDQISGRLDNPARGMLGLLTCRKINDPKKILSRSQDKSKNDKYIIVLEDKDLEKLVRLKLKEGREDVDDYMEKKLNDIID